MCSGTLVLPILSIKLKQIFIIQLHCGMLTIEIRNVHNYIYNTDINTLKGIHIAYSEWVEIRFCCTAFPWNGTRTILEQILQIRQ